jgi:hypothetical protein
MAASQNSFSITQENVSYTGLISQLLYLIMMKVLNNELFFVVFQLQEHIPLQNPPLCSSTTKVYGLKRSGKFVWREQGRERRERRDEKEKRSKGEKTEQRERSEG